MPRLLVRSSRGRVGPVALIQLHTRMLFPLYPAESNNPSIRWGHPLECGRTMIRGRDISKACKVPIQSSRAVEIDVERRMRCVASAVDCGVRIARITRR